MNNLSSVLNKMPESKTPSAPGIDISDLVQRTIKYAMEGLAVAIAAFFLPKWMGGKSLPVSQVGMIALVALATFAILDFYAPLIAGGARQGAGFGIGAHLVGFP
jgi:hypothetical protein